MWASSGFNDSRLGSNQQAGGFLNDSSNFNSPSKSQEERKHGDRVTNIVPCTVAQLLKVPLTEDHVIIGSLSAHIITVVGIIHAVNIQTTKMICMIDDMSGQSIEVQLWTGDNEDTERNATAIEEGRYARVTGALRMSHGKHYIIAFKINPIKEVNEITMHLLEVIHTSMTVTVKDSQSFPVLNPEQLKSESQSGWMSSQFTSSNALGINKSVLCVPAGMSFSHSTGLTKPQQMVLDTIANCADDQGAHISSIFRELKSLNRKTIQDALEFLSNEGHIYSTIDDDHYKSTDA